jgi:hypothetical protein
MLPQHLAARFPKLQSDRGKKTSEATSQYNCLAWSAARDKQHWWEPEQLEPWYYWPHELPSGDYAFDNFVRLFENLGYKKCDDRSFQLFHKKVALYGIYGYFETDKWGFSHVCDQTHLGVWTSKLGADEDIEHHSLESLEGDNEEYGHVRVIMTRACSPLEILLRCFSLVRRALFGS